ncbi:response regulator [Planctomycetales bacterium ZRK34]|nr:response regulator [Planctomycetales bacterium ZRK34]
MQQNNQPLINNTVLVVDDDEVNREILTEILDDDYNLIVTASGEQALDVLDHGPALVLLDIMMPGIDGYETCRRIKELAGPDRRSPHVILVSAKASTTERVRGYEAGADDYLVKPFDEDELLAKVRVQLRLYDALSRLDRANAHNAARADVLENVVEEQSREIADSRDLVVFALAKLAESRDPETGAHLERIRAYCQILAEQLAADSPYAPLIDQAFIDAIYLASPLHDIGKVGIPDAILLKPGRLTNEEYDLMKHHTDIGADALEEVAGHSTGGGFLSMAIEIARSHHEKFDGTGYPNGISGHEIPLSARITAVADVFDALTSVRVYKSAFGPTVARSMIENDSGTHFDPVVVEAFCKRFDDFCEIRQHMNDEAVQSTPSAA